ncbi:MAG: hypothetical protein K2K22_09165, partial [Muribaculaceae bacterium]|nr:hypothetical protein [Muribaculaceae bacterium]
MRLNKLLTAILGGAFLLGSAACTDEVEYTPAPVYDGDEVFFSNELPSTINIPSLTTTSVDVPIMRLRAADELTVGLTGSVTFPDGTDASSIFEVPTEVTFAADATTAEIPIAIISKVENDVNYVLNLAIVSDQASPYGPTEITVNLLYSPWTDLEPYSTTEYEGVMGGPWAGEPIGGIVYYAKSLVNDNLHEYVFPGPRYSNLYFDYDLTVDYSKEMQVPGLDSDKHAYKVSMPQTNTHYDYKDNPVIYQTAYEWVTEFLAPFQNEVADQEYIDWAYSQFDLEDSYFVPEDGAFHLFLVPYTEAGSLLKSSETLLQLPGFMHYEVAFNVKGSFVDADGEESLVVEAYKSRDLASFTYTLLEGALTEEEVEAAAAQLEADTDAVMYVDETTNLLISFEEDGTYTIVAVGYDASGEAVYHTSFEFEAESVAKPSEWEKRGICEYTDDIISPLYGIGNPVWEVEYEENINIPGFYRLVKPYLPFAEDLSDSGVTYKKGKNYLYVHAEDPTCAYIGESLLGCVIGDEGPWIVTSQADGLIAEGATAAQIKAYGMAGTLVDGVFTMPALSNTIG